MVVLKRDVEASWLNAEDCVHGDCEGIALFVPSPKPKPGASLEDRIWKPIDDERTLAIRMKGEQKKRRKRRMVLVQVEDQKRLTHAPNDHFKSKTCPKAAT